MPRMAISVNVILTLIKRYDETAFELEYGNFQP